MTKCIIGKCLLLQILNRRKMTQSDLSDMTGISKTQISEYINNSRKMSLSNAFLIACVLKVDVLDLYEYRIK
ncbi:helix-turn-helix domain-containing protein [Neobacillus vireti]|uniref:helix-turn-helix domain-containing protein n=1 Tax=Neobacillus vireti TaxID=220686 RepID=UPI003B586A42